MNFSARSTWSWPVIVLIALTPLELYSIELMSLPDHGNPLTGGATLTPVYAFMLLFLPVLMLGVLTGRTSRVVNPLTLLYLGYLAVALLGVLSVQSARALVAWGGGALMFLACVYTLSYIDTVQKFETVLTTCIIVGLGVALMGLAEFVGFVFFDRIVEPPFTPVSGRGAYGYGDELMRMYGFFNSVNRLGSYLLIPFGLCCYRFTTGRALRPLYGALVVFFGFTIILCLSRNAQAALLVCLMTMWLFRLDRGPAYATAASLLTVVLLGGGLAVLHPETGVWWLDRLNPFLTSQSGLAMSLWQLVEHLRASVVSSVTNFGLGRGLTNYDDWAYTQGLVSQWGAHSSFLHILAETGIIGFALQVAVILYLVHLSLRCWRRGGSRAHCATYLVAIYLGLIMAGIIRTYYLTEYTLILMALIVINERLGRHGPAMAIAPRVALPIEGSRGALGLRARLPV